MEEIIDIHGFKRQIPSREEIRAEAIDEFVKELEKCVAMQWVDIHDIWEIQEKLKEQK